MISLQQHPQDLDSVAAQGWQKNWWGIFCCCSFSRLLLVEGSMGGFEVTWLWTGSVWLARQPFWPFCAHASPYSPPLLSSRIYHYSYHTTSMCTRNCNRYTRVTQPYFVILLLGNWLDFVMGVKESWFSFVFLIVALGLWRLCGLIPVWIIISKIFVKCLRSCKMILLELTCLVRWRWTLYCPWLLYYYMHVRTCMYRYQCPWQTKKWKRGIGLC